MAAVDQHDRRALGRAAGRWGFGGRGAVAIGGWLGGEAFSSGWLRPQPVTARLATSRAVARDRMGRMMVIPFVGSRSMEPDVQDKHLVVERGR